MRQAAVVVLLCVVVLGAASPALAQESLKLPEGTTDDEAAEALSGGTGLREIELAGPLITEASLVHIKQHWRLKRLVLKNIAVTEAIRWYRMAAEQRNSVAQIRLFYLYLHALGRLKDTNAAISWLRKAAEQGHAEAQHAMGHCYTSGVGVPAGLADAARWYRMAAEQGYQDAQYALGQCYLKGRGVPRDGALAYMWCSLAGRGDELKRKVRRREITEGKRLASEWREKHPKPDEE